MIHRSIERYPIVGMYVKTWEAQTFPYQSSSPWWLTGPFQGLRPWPILPQFPRAFSPFAMRSWCAGNTDVITYSQHNLYRSQMQITAKHFSSRWQWGRNYVLLGQLRLLRLMLCFVGVSEPGFHRWNLFLWNGIGNPLNFIHMLMQCRVYLYVFIPLSSASVYSRPVRCEASRWGKRFCYLLGTKHSQA